MHPLVHLVSGLWGREVRQKDRSVSGSPSRSFTLMDFEGLRSVAPSGIRGRNRLSGVMGLVSVLYSTGCSAVKAGLHWRVPAAEVGYPSVTLAGAPDRQVSAGCAAQLCGVGFCGGASQAWLACPGSLRLMAGHSAAGLTHIFGAWAGLRRSQWCCVVFQSAGGHRGARATCAQRCLVSYRPQCLSGSRRVLRLVAAT